LLTKLFETHFQYKAVLSPYHFLTQTTSESEEEQPLIEAKARFTIDLLRLGCSQILKTKDTTAAGKDVKGSSI
jgi:hypothetical protein